MKFREHLYPPLGWMILAGGFCISTAAVFLVWMDITWAVGVFIGLTAFIAGWFISVTTTISVTEAELAVGRNRITWGYIGEAEALDTGATTAILGVDADARAFLAMPPYAHRAVKVTLDDPADPHPYWLIGTRRPEELAHAIAQEKNR